MARVLAEAGYIMSDVVKLTAFVGSMEEYPNYNELRREYFPKDPPASSTLVTDFIFPGMQVEIEAVAYKES